MKKFNNLERERERELEAFIKISIVEGTYVPLEKNTLKIDDSISISDL